MAGPVGRGLGRRGTHGRGAAGPVGLGKARLGQERMGVARQGASVRLVLAHDPLTGARVWVALSRSHPEWGYLLREGPDGRWLCSCPRFAFRGGCPPPGGPLRPPASRRQSRRYPVGGQRSWRRVTRPGEGRADAGDHHGAGAGPAHTGGAAPGAARPGGQPHRRQGLAGPDPGAAGGDRAGGRDRAPALRDGAGEEGLPAPGGPPGPVLQGLDGVLHRPGALGPGAGRGTPRRGGQGALRPQAAGPVGAGGAAAGCARRGASPGPGRRGPRASPPGGRTTACSA